MYDLQLCFYDFLKLDMEDFQRFLQNEKMLVCKCYLVKDYIQIKAGTLQISFYVKKAFSSCAIFATSCIGKISCFPSIPRILPPEAH